MKNLAAFLMVVDHVGALFFPDWHWLRWLGRLSFPIFARHFCSGMTYTSSKKRYFFRLLHFGALSQIPYFYLFDGFNIILAFAYNLFLFSYAKNRPLLIGAGAAFASYLNLDYGWYATLVIYVLGDARGLRSPAVNFNWFLVHVGSLFSFPLYQLFAYFSIFLMPTAKAARISQSSKFFYWFYPIHLAILAIAKFCLNT